MAAGICKKPAGDLDLFQQGLEVGVQQLRALADGPGDEAAVGAAGGAEGDAHIEGNVGGLQQVRRRHGGCGAVQGQLPAVRGNVVNIPEELVGAFGRAAFQDVFGGDLGGADAGQSAPGGGVVQQLDGCQIVALLQGAAAQAHGLLGRLQASGGGNGAVVHHDFCGGGEPGPAPVEGGGGFTVFIFREQGHLQLLHGIAVVMTDECQFHGSYLSKICRGGSSTLPAAQAASPRGRSVSFSSDHPEITAVISGGRVTDPPLQ